MQIVQSRCLINLLDIQTDAHVCYLGYRSSQACAMFLSHYMVSQIRLTVKWDVIICRNNNALKLQPLNLSHTHELFHQNAENRHLTVVLKHRL